MIEFFRLPLLLISVYLISCCKMDSPAGNPDCSGENAHRYYHSEIIPTEFQDLYGSWTLIQTTGGFTGNGFGTKELSIRMCPYGVFRLYKNNAEINLAKMEYQSKTTDHVDIKFSFEKQDTIIGFGTPMSISFTHPDTMLFKSPCCDQYNYLFARK